MLLLAENDTIIFLVYAAGLLFNYSLQISWSQNNHSSIGIIDFLNKVIKTIPDSSLRMRTVENHVNITLIRCNSINDNLETGIIGEYIITTVRHEK